MQQPTSAESRSGPPPFKYADPHPVKQGLFDETLRALIQSGGRLYVLGSIVTVLALGSVALGFKVRYLGLAAELSLHIYVGMLFALAIWFVATVIYRKRQPLDFVVLRWVRFVGVASVAVMASNAAVNMTRVPVLQPAAVAGKHQFAVAALNVHTDNMDMKEAAQWALSNAPDVMAFTETSRYQTAMLKKELGVRYEFEYLSKTEGPFGIAVYSVYPIENATFAHDDGADQPVFTGTVRFPARPLELSVVHPMPPFTPEYLKKRDARVMETVRKHEGKASIIMGDFNATLHSTLFNEIGKKSYGVAPVGTFATVMPYALQIDHILLSNRQLTLAESGSVPVEGSDHRLVWASFHLDRPPVTK